MAALLADGWFYISSAGLLISGVLFFFLLGQYRAACEAADASDSEHIESPAAAVHPVWVHEEPAHAPVASVTDAKPAQMDAPAATGGISPAVVYLQNIKGELAEIHEEVRTLAKRVDGELSAVSTRDEALIARLGELTALVESLKAVASAAVAPAPAKAPAAQKAPVKEKVPVADKAPEPDMKIELASRPMAEETPKSKPAPEPSPDETISMQLSAVIDAVAPAPAPALVPAPATAPAPVVPEAPMEEKPRRGPVWPV